MTAAIALILANGDHTHMDWGDGWWMWIWGPMTMVALVALIVWAVRAGTASTRPSTPEEDRTDPNRRARAILAERYARGEIDTDEYHDRLHHLQ